MKTLVVFKSYLGASEKYAQWIAEKVSGDLVVFNKAKNNLLSEYDVIVVVSGTYAGHMPLVRFLSKHWKAIANKKVIGVAVGAAPADDDWSVKSYQKIPDLVRNNIKYFKLPSSIEKKGRESLRKSDTGPVVDYIKTIKI